jgi:hypothetical protein
MEEKYAEVAAKNNLLSQDVGQVSDRCRYRQSAIISTESSVSCWPFPATTLLNPV